MSEQAARWAALAVVSLVVGAGCGGAAYGPSASKSAAPAAYESPSAAPGAPASESVADVAPSERQGLATQWGETRESWVSETTFVRAEPSRPLRAFAIRYNDRAGVDAMTGHAAEWGRAIDAPEVSVELQGEGGALPTARVGERWFVTGTSGERYSIRVSNHTGRRVEVVASVDGLDVLNGKEASLARRGYVVGPYESVDIDGFRQSQGSVAAFRFGAVGDSYAAQTGDARNVGVIGVAVFGEREARPSADEVRLRNTASPFPGSDPRYAAPPRN